MTEELRLSDKTFLAQRRHAYQGGGKGHLQMVYSLPSAEEGRFEIPEAPQWGGGESK